MESMRESLISELRRDGEHETADRILAEHNYSMGISHQRAMDRVKILRDAEVTVKKQYVDWDHCSQSARAVKAFLEGVSWTLEQL